MPAKPSCPETLKRAEKLRVKRTVTIAQRVEKYGKHGLYDNNGKLYCKACGKKMNETREDSVCICSLSAFAGWVQCHEAGSDPRGHLWVTWGVYLCASKPPLADIILSHPPDLTRCDSVTGLAIPAMSGHIQYRGTASGDLYIGISGINRVSLS